MQQLPLLWTDGSLLAAAGSVVSVWTDVREYDDLRLGRAATGGTYAFEIDWSRDAVTSDFTETVVVADATTVVKPVGARFARFRVRNTGGAAFTAHRTTVYAKALN